MADGELGDILSNRKQQIVKAADELEPLEQQKKSVNEQIREVKTRYIKALGITIKAFNVGYSAYKMEEPEDQKKYLDDIKEVSEALLGDIRESYDTLEQGEQVDWVDIAERKTESATPPAAQIDSAAEPTTAEMVATRNQGRQASLSKSGRATDNPWPVGTPAHETWHEGWMDGQKELAKQLEKPPEETAGQVDPPRRRGRPPGARDAQPRQRPARPQRQTSADRRRAAERLFN